MKKEEEFVQEYLIKHGFQRIVYEPDGNVPPDFSVDEEIGVEVRRLSQNLISKDGGYKSLEQDRIRLMRCVREVFNEFNQPTPVDSYWVVINYQRPLGDLKEIRKRLRETLDKCLSKDLKCYQDISVTKSVKISFAKAVKPDIRQFKVGIESDMDSGGSVISMYVENINLCISEKQRKIQPKLENYRRWWLILVDMIVAISGPDTNMIIREITKPKEFERIIVIDPIKGEATFEI
jgi:hypothetical protein